MHYSRCVGDQHSSCFPNNPIDRRDSLCRIPWRAPNARIVVAPRHQKEAAVKIGSPILAATLTISAAALALATLRPMDAVSTEDAQRPAEAQAQHGPWFI